MVTLALRLMASLLAARIAADTSKAAALIFWIPIYSLKDGRASDARMPATAMTTSNSRSENPDCGNW